MKKYLIAFSFFTLALAACKKNNPEDVKPPTEENEIITTFSIQLTDSVSHQKQTFTFKDLDGEGGKPPVETDTIRIDKNRTYKASLLILDETKTPVDTTSNEIEELKNDHLFFYTPSSGLGLAVHIDDKDDKNLPVGLRSTWKTGNTSSGTLHIVLRHQPNEKNGTYAPGSTDIDLNFITIIH